MTKYYLAIDIGASSGRHILGSIEHGKIVLIEIYRFDNRLVTKDGHLCWDLEQLFKEILEGMKQCSFLGKLPESIGIDTWGVDFVLLDENDSVLGNTISYRDIRTEKSSAEVYQRISPIDLYKKTGIQMLVFNTIHQLMSVKQTNPEYLERAKHFLMIPEYFNYLLTGIKKNEYTNATTTQLVNAKKKTWDYELMELLAFPKEIFGPLSAPKSDVGCLKSDIQELVGFNTKIILPATHDTGSAVLAVPTNNYDFIYLSSGTWSLIGVERMNPDCSELSRHENFTNEGGVDSRFRFQKNIMGLWMIQSLRKELNNQYTFNEICDMARKSIDFPSIINVNDDRFLAPTSMMKQVKEICHETCQQVPENASETAACIYNSLAHSYAKSVQDIERITKRSYKTLHIVGGGSKDDFLNTLTAIYTGKDVFAGPSEATAIGNLLVQMLKAEEFCSIEKAREAVLLSFEVIKVE